MPKLGRPKKEENYRTLKSIKLGFTGMGLTGMGLTGKVGIKKEEEIKIKEIASEFLIENNEWERIEVRKNIKTGKLMIFTRNGKNEFVFYKSDPQRVRRIARLLMESSRL